MFLAQICVLVLSAAACEGRVNAREATARSAQRQVMRVLYLARSKERILQRQFVTQFRLQDLRYSNIPSITVTLVLCSRMYEC